MIHLDWKKVHACVLAGAMVATASVALAPLTPAVAQVRALPDFTDLVEQVGPSVVNIRTLEKVAERNGSGDAAEEQMLEFFKRFGVPIPNGPNLPRQTGAEWVQSSFCGGGKKPFFTRQKGAKGFKGLIRLIVQNRFGRKVQLSAAVLIDQDLAQLFYAAQQLVARTVSAARLAPVLPSRIL